MSPLFFTVYYIAVAFWQRNHVTCGFLKIPMSLVFMAASHVTFSPWKASNIHCNIRLHCELKLLIEQSGYLNYKPLNVLFLVVSNPATPQFYRKKLRNRDDWDCITFSELVISIQMVGLRFEISTLQTISRRSAFRMTKTHQVKRRLIKPFIKTQQVTYARTKLNVLLKASGVSGN